MKSILLTGASGTVGKEVLEQLCGPDVRYEVTVFDRKTRQSAGFFNRFRD